MYGGKKGRAFKMNPVVPFFQPNIPLASSSSYRCVIQVIVFGKIPISL